MAFSQERVRQLAIPLRRRLLEECLERGAPLTNRYSCLYQLGRNLFRIKPCLDPKLTIDTRGSIKANIGHLEGSSGPAGVIKAVMMLERGIIPPQALFETLNPAIDAAADNLKVPRLC